MNNELYRIKVFPYFFWWVVSAVFAWPLSAIALGLLTMPVQFLVPDERFYGDNTASSLLVAVFFVPMAGGTIGFVIGSLQYWLLRKKLYWAADGWRRWSFFGGVLASFIVIVAGLAIELAPESIQDRWQTLIWMPAFVIPLSFMQLQPLRRAVRNAWLWLLGNAVGGVVFANVLAMNDPASNGDESGMLWLGIISLAVGAQAIITGFVMLYLFERHLRPMETDEEAQRSYGSLWDHAI